VPQGTFRGGHINVRVCVPGWDRAKNMEQVNHEWFPSRTIKCLQSRG
jgi:hypothetical protein